MSATTSKAESQKRSRSSERTSELRVTRTARGGGSVTSGSNGGSNGSALGAGAVVVDTNLRRLEQAREIATLVAAAGLAKKAEDVQIIEVTGKVDYADFLVLMTGTSDRHVAAIAQNVESELTQQGVRSLALEGLPLANWVLIDFVDVVVHVFQSEWREIYDLDGLWMDADRVAIPDSIPEVEPEGTRS